MHCMYFTVLYKSVLDRTFCKQLSYPQSEGVHPDVRVQSSAESILTLKSHESIHCGFYCDRLC